MVELKLPAVGLPTLESRAAFIERATAVVDELTVDSHDRNSTWINILNAAGRRVGNRRTQLDQRSTCDCDRAGRRCDGLTRTALRPAARPLGRE